MEYCLLGNQYCVSSRGHTNNLECKSSTKIRNHDIISLDKRNTLKSISQVPFIYRRYCLSASKYEHLSWYCLHFSYHHGVSDGNTSIIPYKTIDSNYSLAFI